MAARARLLQLSIAVVNLAILGLAFTSIWPFPHGDFRIHLPSARDVTWTYVDGVVIVHAPYSVDNGGFYDVDDLVVSYTVNNATREFAAQRFDLGSLPAGSVTPGSLDFTIDLIGMYENNTQWLIFNDDILDFHVEVSCYYTMKLIKFDASYQSSVIWNALIEDWGVGNVSLLRLLNYTGEPVEVNYWLNTSDLLSRLPPARLNVSVLGDGAPVAWGETTVQVGGHHDGLLALNRQPTLPSQNISAYVLVYSIDVAGFHFSQSRVLEVP